MALNPYKRKSMLVSRSRNHHTLYFTIDSTPIENVASLKYLGIAITHDLNWSWHVTNIILSSNKTLGFLKRNHCSAPQHINYSHIQHWLGPNSNMHHSFEILVRSISATP